MIENVLVEDIKTAKELHKDFKSMIITPKQFEEHNFIVGCWVCKRPLNFQNFKVKNHKDFTGKCHSSILVNVIFKLKLLLKYLFSCIICLDLNYC